MSVNTSIIRNGRRPRVIPMAPDDSVQSCEAVVRILKTRLSSP